MTFGVRLAISSAGRAWVLCEFRELGENRLFKCLMKVLETRLSADSGDQSVDRQKGAELVSNSCFTHQSQAQ